MSVADLKSPITDTSMDAIVVTDDEGRILLFNPAAEDLFGYKADHILGHFAVRLIAPLNRALVANAFAAIRKTGNSTLIGKRTQMESVTSNGEIFTAESTFTRSEFEGKMIFTFVIRDITLEKDHREKLERSELTYRLIAKASFDAIWDWDILNNQISWNDGVFKLFGYVPEEVRPDASWWENRVHPDDWKNVGNGLYEALAAHDSEFWSDRYRFRHQDGTYRDVLDRGYIIRGRDGKAIRFVGAMFDLSWLIEKERHLEDAVRARDQFVGMVSHELKNPLMAIETGLDYIEKLLVDKSVSEKVHGVIKKFRPSLKRMEQVVSDLMDVSLIETRRLKMHLKNIDLDLLIKQVITSNQPLAQKRKVRLRQDLPIESISVRCDADRIRQVISRLVENAIYSTPEGRTVQVRAASFRGKNDMLNVRIEIEDEGPGIAQAYLPDIFKRFWQPRGTAYRGTGLSLFIAQGIIRENQGTISTICNTGRGCTFAVELPAETPIFKAA